MTVAASALEGAFANPAQDAAAAFRCVLDAFARPGRVGEMRGAEPPEGVSPAAGAALLTLADAETALWLPERLVGSPVAEWLSFHTNAPLTADRKAAQFAVGCWEELGLLTGWSQGTPSYPDRSATLIVEVEALEGGPALTLSGPGIPGSCSFAPTLPPEAGLQLAANHRRFPLGLDLLFSAGTHVAALPRSTRIGA
ncbi:MAG: phosphonate C-P lyase system protein PhnH [Pseudomonadota bacterium]